MAQMAGAGVCSGVLSPKPRSGGRCNTGRMRPGGDHLEHSAGLRTRSHEEHADVTQCHAVANPGVY